MRFPGPVDATSLIALALAAAMAVATAACRNRPASSSGGASPAAASPSAPPPTPTPMSAPSTDAWLGQWNGPEGTFLLLTRRDGGYAVKIQSLDGPNVYAGVPAGERIRFERDGRTETIRVGSGDETGMKWLAGKKDCLIVRTGEGFCRD